MNPSASKRFEDARFYQIAVEYRRRRLDQLGGHPMFRTWFEKDDEAVRRAHAELTRQST